MCQPGGLTTPRPLLKWPLQQSHAAARDITPDPFHMLPAAGRERRQPCPHGGSPPRPKTATPRFKWGKRLCAHSPFSNAHGQFAPQNPGGSWGGHGPPPRVGRRYYSMPRQRRAEPSTIPLPGIAASVPGTAPHPTGKPTHQAVLVPSRNPWKMFKLARKRKH